MEDSRNWLGVKEVEFAGLERLKERDLLWFGKEIDAIRRYRPMTPSLPLDEVKDELRDLRAPDDDKLCDPLEEDAHQGQLSENSSSFKASDSGVQEDVEVFFTGAFGSFGGGSEGSKSIW